MAPKRVEVIRDYEEIVPLLKEYVPEDPAEEKLKWWCKDLDHVCAVYADFLVAVGKTGKTLGKKPLAAACQDLYEGSRYLHEAWAGVICSAIGHARGSRFNISTGSNTEPAVLRILKAYGFDEPAKCAGKPAKCATTAAAPAAAKAAEAAEAPPADEDLWGSGKAESSDVEVVETAHAGPQPTHGKLGEAEAQLAKVMALFGPESLQAPSRKPLSRHDSIQSIASSEAEVAIASASGQPPEATADVPVAAPSKSPAKVSQGNQFSLGAYTNAPESGDSPLRDQELA